MRCGRSWSAKKFSAIVILTLAFGLGANTAVFSVLHAVVLRPLPYDDPDRLVRVYHVDGEADNYMPAAGVPRVQGQQHDARSGAGLHLQQRGRGPDRSRAARARQRSCRSDPTTSA